MARKILLDTAYTFTPSTATIVIPRYIPRERLILITDVTKNVVLYKFSDPTLTATSYSAVAGQTTWFRKWLWSAPVWKKKWHGTPVL